MTGKNRKCNFFITGTSGIGKSTLLQEIINEVIGDEKVYGFVTLPYYEGMMRKGFYMHSLMPMEANDQPISVQYTTFSCEPILETFETLGVKLLQRALEDEADYIVMDEIGVLESKAHTFCKGVQACLDGKQCVLGVLKEKDHPFLNKIRTRQDTVVYSLTKENKEAVQQALLMDITTYIKEEKI